MSVSSCVFFNHFTSARKWFSLLTAVQKHLHKQPEKLDSIGRIKDVQNAVKCSSVNKQIRGGHFPSNLFQFT